MRESEDVNHEKQPEPAAKKVSNSLQEVDEQEKEENYNKVGENKTNITLNEIGIQTDAYPVDCKKCQEVQAKQMKIINELTKEKSQRVLVESTLDIKKIRINKAEDEITKLKEENAKLKEDKGKLLNALKKSTQSKKANEEVIKSLTKTNTDLNNENKTLKKLYEEERNKTPEQRST